MTLYLKRLIIFVKKYLHWISQKMQNGYLIGLAKKIKKKIICSSTFQGSLEPFYFLLFLSLFFPETFFTFQWIIMSIFFSQFLIKIYFINMIDITMRIWFSYLTSANTTFEKYNYYKIQLF